jgi:hypothetical protein
MSYRFLESLLTSRGARAVVIGVMSLAPIPIAGQTSPTAKAKATATAKTWTQPRDSFRLRSMNSIGSTPARPFRCVTPFFRRSTPDRIRFINAQDRICGVASFRVARYTDLSLGLK